MQIKLIIFLFLLNSFAIKCVGQNRADWLRDRKWGVMSHFLSEGFEKNHQFNMTPQKWNKIIDQFNVDTLAYQLSSIGAGYFIITIGQNSGYFLSPNSTYDRLSGVYPGKCSRRDLIADLSKALALKGIPLIVYLPSGAPDRDSVAVSNLRWIAGPHPNKKFQTMWEEIIREWSLRWGTSVSGWWFDGCYWPNLMYRSCENPNFGSFASSARAGNSNSIVAFNTGVIPRLISVTPDEDYTAGEINDPSKLEIKNTKNGKIDGTQVHVLTYLGETWAGGAPRYTSREVLKFNTEVIGADGAITWDIPIQIDGSIPDQFVKILEELSSEMGKLNAN